MIVGADALISPEAYDLYNRLRFGSIRGIDSYGKHHDREVTDTWRESSIV